MRFRFGFLLGEFSVSELSEILAKQISPATSTVYRVLRVLLFRIIAKTGWLPQVLHEIEGVGADKQTFLRWTLVSCWIDARRRRGTARTEFPRWMKEMKISFQCPPHIFQDEKLAELLIKYGMDGILTEERIIGYDTNHL